jgi:hypothetical protein
VPFERRIMTTQHRVSVMGGLQRYGDLRLNVIVNVLKELNGHVRHFAF